MLSVIVSLVSFSHLLSASCWRVSQSSLWNSSLVIYLLRFWHLWKHAQVAPHIISLLSSLLSFNLSSHFSCSFSCIFLPDAIGVGSSGALMGILSAWLIWIIFRWFPLFALCSLFNDSLTHSHSNDRKKIPDECKSQRNCQLLMVTAAIALTVRLSSSFLLLTHLLMHCVSLPSRSASMLIGELISEEQFKEFCVEFLFSQESWIMSTPRSALFSSSSFLHFTSHSFIYCSVEFESVFFGSVWFNIWLGIVHNVAQYESFQRELLNL